MTKQNKIILSLSLIIPFIIIITTIIVFIIFANFNSINYSKKDYRLSENKYTIVSKNVKNINEPNEIRDIISNSEKIEISFLFSNKKNKQFVYNNNNKKYVKPIIKFTINSKVIKSEVEFTHTKQNKISLYFALNNKDSKKYLIDIIILDNNQIMLVDSNYSFNILFKAS